MNSNAGNEDRTREMVSQAYTEALARAKQGEGSCCSPPSCCGPAPAQTDAPSFGCGNPLALAEVRPGETVLDLGSGAGVDLIAAAEKVGPKGRVIGVDMTDAMIEAARETAARAGHSNIEIRKGIIEELPVEDGTVDWVISNCVINLSPEKPRVFSEIARVLRPGGRFSIFDIVVGDLPDWIRQNAAAYSACIAGAISEEEYVSGLKAAGLREIAVPERVRYTADQILAMAKGDFDGFGMNAEELHKRATQVEGKIVSARFVGTR
ncbi:MAG: methyltransferase domain-containing protein [Planctomycetota bacterium]|jgi:SAM-dependent methyltransferase